MLYFPRFRTPKRPKSAHFCILRITQKKCVFPFFGEGGSVDFVYFKFLCQESFYFDKETFFACKFIAKTN